MTDTITIYKQIHPNQCDKIHALGYRSLINVRPDHEQPSQPSSSIMAQASKQAGLSYVHIPFTSGSQDESEGRRLNKALVLQFAEAYHRLPKPIMMYCGTGHRAKLLYQGALMQGLLDTNN